MNQSGDRPGWGSVDRLNKILDRPVRILRLAVRSEVVSQFDSAMLTYFLFQIPKPIFLDASFGAPMNARMLGQLARPEDDKLAQEALRDARDLIAAVTAPDHLDQTERRCVDVDGY